MKPTSWLSPGTALQRKKKTKRRVDKALQSSLHPKPRKGGAHVVKWVPVRDPLHHYFFGIGIHFPVMVRTATNMECTRSSHVGLFQTSYILFQKIRSSIISPSLGMHMYVYTCGCWRRRMCVRMYVYVYV